MTTPQDDRPSAVTLTADNGAELDASRSAMRYVALRQKAARCNLEWLNTGDDAHRRKRDDYLFRSAEIVTTVRDVLGHAASKHFAREAERVYGPVRFWPE